MRRPPTLLNQTGYLAGLVSELGRRGCEAVLARSGLRLPHYEVLVTLADFGPLAQQEISDSLVHDKSHLVRRIDDLERDGLVTRARAVDDRRRNRISITEAGRALVAELQRADADAERDYLGPLSESEQDQLRGLLTRVVTGNEQRNRPI